MGLRLRVAVSFVAVTLGAVLVVEALLIGFFAPPVIGAQVAEQNDVNKLRADTATAATQMSQRASGAGGALAFPGAAIEGGQPCEKVGRLHLIRLVLNAQALVQLTELPDCYPAGSKPRWLPDKVLQGLGDSVGGADKSPAGAIAWAVEPVYAIPANAPSSAADLAPTGLAKVPGARLLGTLYQQIPLDTVRAENRTGDVRPLVTPGVIVLGAALPVGLLVGYVSMRGPVRRLRRLADTTEALADGELDRRIPARGRDELARLERSVNRMAEQLSLALAAERELAGAHARTTERARIARELHDSISQELFSLRMLASGLRRALPAGSPLQPQIESLYSCAGTATREMRALLLELRPVALTGAGLAGALEQLAQTYRGRLGVSVVADLTDPALDPEQEHALLRIAQEAMLNAARHGAPGTLTITLRPGLLRVTDDGDGFEPERVDPAAGGLGLKLMRERVAELGAELSVASAPGSGTTVEVRLP